MGKSEVFTGHSAEMKKATPWLASEDILGRGDVELAIKAIHRHEDAEFDGGRKETVFSVEFEKAKKQLIVNSVNRKKIVAKFGPKVADWVGKKVVLYVDTNVKMMGKTVSGIRIR